MKMSDQKAQASEDTLICISDESEAEDNFHPFPSKRRMLPRLSGQRKDTTSTLFNNRPRLILGESSQHSRKRTCNWIEQEEDDLPDPQEPSAIVIDSPNRSDRVERSSERLIQCASPITNRERVVQRKGLSSSWPIVLLQRCNHQITIKADIQDSYVSDSCPPPAKKVSVREHNNMVQCEDRSLFQLHFGSPVKTEDGLVQHKDSPVQHNSREQHTDILVKSEDSPVQSGASTVLYKDGPVQYEDSPVQSGASTVLYEDSPVQSGVSTVLYKDGPVLYEDSPVQSGNSTVLYKDSPVQSGNSTVLYEDSPVLYEDSPVLYEDSTVLYKDGPVQSGNSTVLYEDSPVLYEDSPVLYEDSTVLYEDGTVLYKDGPVQSGNSKVLYEDSPVLYEDSLVQSGNSTVLYEDGPVQHKDSPVQSEDSLLQSKDSPVQSGDSAVLYEDGPVQYNGGYLVQDNHIDLMHYLHGPRPKKRKRSHHSNLIDTLSNSYQHSNKMSNLIRNSLFLGPYWHVYAPISDLSCSTTMFTEYDEAFIENALEYDEDEGALTGALDFLRDFSSSRCPSQKAIADIFRKWMERKDGCDGENRRLACILFQLMVSYPDIAPAFMFDDFISVFDSNIGGSLLLAALEIDFFTRTLIDKPKVRHSLAHCHLSLDGRKRSVDNIVCLIQSSLEIIFKDDIPTHSALHVKKDQILNGSSSNSNDKSFTLYLVDKNSTHTFCVSDPKPTDNIFSRILEFCRENSPVEMARPHSSVLPVVSEGPKTRPICVVEPLQRKSPTVTHKDMERLFQFQRLLDLSVESSLYDEDLATDQVANLLQVTYLKLKSLKARQLLLGSISSPLLTCVLSHKLLQETRFLTSAYPYIQRHVNEKLEQTWPLTFPSVSQFVEFEAEKREEFAFLLYYLIWGHLEISKRRLLENKKSRLLHPGMGSPSLPSYLQQTSSLISDMNQSLPESVEHEATHQFLTLTECCFTMITKVPCFD